MKKVPGDPDGRLPLIDLVRTASILLVLMSHFFSCAPDLGLSDASSPSFHGMRWIFQSGRYGVTMFFVVSGFLITRVLAGRPGGLFGVGAREFYARRCGRILPLLLLTLALGALVRVLLSGAGDPRTLFTFGAGAEERTALFWISLFLFQFNWYRAFQPVQGLHWEVLWSLSIEEQFYLFYPLLLSRVAAAGRLKWALGAIILSAIPCRIAAGRHVSVAVYSSFGNFDAMAMGILLFLVCRDHGDLLRRHPGWCRGASLVGGTVLAAALLLTNPYNDRDLGSTLVASGLFLFLLGGLPRGWDGGGMDRVLFLPGRLSYGCYLLHPAVLYLLWPLMAGMPWPAACGLFVSGVVAVAWVSFHAFEEPMNRRFRRGFLALWPPAGRRKA